MAVPALPSQIWDVTSARKGALLELPALRDGYVPEKLGHGAGHGWVVVHLRAIQIMTALTIILEE